MKENIAQKIKLIDTLQQQIESFGLLGKEVLNKINYKFRLDWNYYSNRMEGNTLTIEETKSVMVNNINVNDKPIKDIMEMNGHDKTIQSILEMGKGELNISEKRIIDIHKAIMYEDDPLEKAKIGQWKTQPNHVINYKHEKFDFTPVNEVSLEMHNLVNWVNAQNDKIKVGSKNALHPVLLAFEFHLRYLTIHPFYDGNGRTARILMNLILISHGYPPIYIKEEEKSTYYSYLADVQGYGADKFLLYNVMSNYLIRSLNMVLDAARGREIDEPEDLDKKIELLDLELTGISADEEVKLKYGEQAFLHCYDTWMRNLVLHIVPVIQKFNRFFTGVNHHIRVSRVNVHVSFQDQPLAIIEERLSEMIDNQITQIGQAQSPEFAIQASYGVLIKGGLRSIGCNYSLAVKFDDIKYEVLVDEFDEASKGHRQKLVYERLLHQSLTDKEIKELGSMFGNIIYQHIDFYTKQAGLRK